MRRAPVMLGIAALAACSREPSTAQATIVQPAADGCLEQFVQEYVEARADEPPAPPSGICFEGTQADGPPKYPARERRIRVEYDRGDYYAVQESATWTISEELDLARNCMVAKLDRQKVVELRQGGRKDSVLMRNGATQRSADTGESYGARIALGGGPSALPTVANPTAQVAREETPYGTCLRAAPLPGTSLCTLEQPRKCRSNEVVLPIEIRFPDAQGGTQVGRTTSLERASADKSAWVLP